VDVRVPYSGDNVLITGPESLDEEPSIEELREMVEAFHANPNDPQYADYVGFS
jgi:hypothetical protein